MGVVVPLVVGLIAPLGRTQRVLLAEIFLALRDQAGVIEGARRHGVDQDVGRVVGVGNGVVEALRGGGHELAHQIRMVMDKLAAGDDDGRVVVGDAVA